jgi:hypothetical protein
LIVKLFTRHIAALLITYGFHLVKPSAIVDAELYFQAHAVFSIIYVAVVYQTKIREVIYLILIEALAVIYTTITYIQWYLSLKSQWFYANFEFIMLVCFLTEFGVIMFGATHGGMDRIISTLRQCRFYDNNRD